jgi:hypothetical protein
MALPTCLIPGIAARYAIVAGLSYLMARRIPKGRFANHIENAMDNTEPGLEIRRHAGQVNGAFRWVKHIGLRKAKLALRVDGVVLARLRVSKPS